MQVEFVQSSWFSCRFFFLCSLLLHIAYSLQLQQPAPELEAWRAVQTNVSGEEAWDSLLTSLHEFGYEADSKVAKVLEMTPQELLCVIRRHVNVSELKAIVGRHYKSCAVVSNSGVMRNHRYGRAIDAADMVARFNDAPLYTYKGEVGKKEGMRFINSKVLRKLANGKYSRKPGGKFITESPMFAKRLVVIMADEDDRRRKADIVKARARLPPVPLQVLGHNVVQAAEDVLRELYDDVWFKKSGKVSHPTSGMVGMLLMLSVCDSVTAYGMAATQHSQKKTYHYWEITALTADKNTWHQSFSAEKDLWRRMAPDHDGSRRRLDESDIVTMPGLEHITCNEMK